MDGLSLDHFIIGVSDLEASAASLGSVLARAPSWRGRHPSYGTANVLFRLDNAYLELLAPDPERETLTAWTGSLGFFLETRGEGLFSIALATSDVAAAAAAAAGFGLTVDEPLPGEGVNRVDGATRRWINARIAPETTRGTRAFLIQHLSPPDALPPAALQADRGFARTVAGASIETSDAEGARRMWRQGFGLREEASEHLWRFDLGNADLLLRAGAGEADAPDRWQRLLLTADSLTSLADRLDAARIDFEQGEFPEAEGVLVRCCGADLLFIEGQ